MEGWRGRGGGVLLGVGIGWLVCGGGERDEVNFSTQSLTGRERTEIRTHIPHLSPTVI